MAIVVCSGGEYRVSAKARVAQRAIELLANEPAGLPHSALLHHLTSELPEIPFNTIRGCLATLVDYKAQDVYKPARGLFQHAMFREAPSSSPVPFVGGVVREEDFYCPFAEYLIQDLEECTKCIALGGCLFHEKWGTPDVIGVRRARESDIIKFDTEVVCAEVKTDTRNLITAFGQACSYRLFSHRCYLVIPRSSPTEDLARLEALCLAVGLGLVLFDNQNAEDPQFTVRVRATRNEPDAFYVNRNLKLIEDRLFE